MGTSQSLKPSVKGQKEWGNFTRAASLLQSKKDYSKYKMENFFEKYSAAKRIQGKYELNSQTAEKTINRLFGIISNIGNNGLSNEFSEYGSEISKFSVNKIIGILADKATNGNGNFNEISAKAASISLLEELLENCANGEDVEKIINGMDDEKKEDYIYDYFGYYIYEDISLILFEKFQKKDPVNCNESLKEVKKYIFSKIYDIKEKKNNRLINWIGNEGAQIIQEIKNKVFRIFI